MRRREFITLLGGAIVAWPLAARAQQQGLPTVGFVHVGSNSTFGHLVSGFRKGLAESDFVEGRNVSVVYRWAEGELSRLPELMADVMRHQPSVIAGNSLVFLATKNMTGTIPLVFTATDDPIRLGFVASLNRPGGNMTGVYFFNTGLEAKRLGILRDFIPNATSIAVLVDPAYPTAEAQVIDVQSAASQFGMNLIIQRAHSENDVNAAFNTFVQQRPQALLVCASPFFNSRRDQLVALATRHKLPALSEVREFAMAGGLASYGNSIIDVYRQLGVYTGRVLKGEKPADLPVVQPTKFELVINLKTARSLGVKISDNLITLADEVIE